MKITVYILIGVTLILTYSCNSKIDNRKNYVETEPSFFNLRNGDWIPNKWIRKPENLLMIHETFKKFGYMNLIQDNLLFDSPLIIQDIYINKKGCHLLDSLELTYSQPIVREKYYREFWLRRKAEKNDSVVYLIVKDINFAIKTKMGSGVLSLNANSKNVNDTLLQLLKIEFNHDTLTSQIAISNFETLRNLGFHNSAYNLLYENYKYQDINWYRDSLVNTLTPSNLNTNAWIQDDTK
jgi:hypothetical protein